MSLTPGASSAFKATPAKATGVKPQQVGAVKFPGKIDPSKAAPAAPAAGVKVALSLPNFATSNPALGAMFGLLFGRVAARVPGISQMLSNPMLRDAALGAAVATAVQEAMEARQGSDPYNPRPDQPTNGWTLQ